MTPEATPALAPLPAIMVAPNGARLRKTDHPALPETIAQIVSTARACAHAGADGIHAHVRDKDGNHTLDEGLYRELLAELAQVVPDMVHQITTEAVGRYTPIEQRRLVLALRPRSVSVSLAEMTSQGWDTEVEHFYRWCGESGVAVQHILYSPDDLAHLLSLRDQGRLPAGRLQMLFVLGRYGHAVPSRPETLPSFLNLLPQLAEQPDWAICAFGRSESACLRAAERLGGKIRIGFENNTLHEDGTLARDNAERIEHFIASRDTT
ncbi:3-keto-5-aminohexanoate cleavage protein [Hoeflea sp. YIM 152468]|uniref:3-keto-5-aminohexanoate cleavage protein n=1 Tax=Hoeflea sp. YIM 152468 TaxID=3031759 RepID=UPI0023DBAEC2|nr:3-keto-5-aminohexanoate cleavage protein [Hoeflea sp. YIM 152468]MDF1608170.1 3-keto-5-aminohexanoate cleavage protein [Hoeflea sp. YIM 152468]